MMFNNGLNIRTTPTNIDAIILAGQSNEAGGLGIGAFSPIYTNPQINTWIFDKNNDRSSANNGRIGSYLYGFNNNWDSTHYTTTGPDISLGYAYYQNTGRPLLLMKYAQGGSGLVDDGSTVNANGLWQIDANPVQANGLLQYNICIQYFLIPCINALLSRGIRPNIKAIHWCQGEWDSQNLSTANGYATQLSRLFNQLITDLTPYNVLSANFKPIITRTNINTSGGTYVSTVRTAQVNTANSFNGYWIDSDGYTLVGNLHYDSVSQQQHGIDVYDKLALIS